MFCGWEGGVPVTLWLSCWHRDTQPSALALQAEPGEWSLPPWASRQRIDSWATGNGLLVLHSQSQPEAPDPVPGAAGTSKGLGGQKWDHTTKPRPDFILGPYV